MRELKSGDCKGQCDWHRDGQEKLDDQPLFSCGVCGTEWVPSETWTPRNADGEVAPEVQAARDEAEARTEAVAQVASETGKKGAADTW